VNGERVAGECVLKSGDVVGFGGLMMRFEASPGAAEQTDVAPATSFSNAFGGPNYGDVNQAGRDLTIRNWNDYRVEEYDPSEELFQGRGPGRVLMIVGSIVALCGFVGVGAVIFGSGPSSSGPLDMKIGPLPVVVLGFGAFLVGGLVAGIGQGMSKAARAREQAALRRSGRW
jgi:hypothetical protein